MSISAIAISSIVFVLPDGKHASLSPVHAFHTFADDTLVKEGVKVTISLQITPRDYPNESYSDIEQFIQGQHTVPPGIEARVAGMHSGESKTFSLSAEEGFGPRDETKIQLIPTNDVPPEAKEGDTIVDEAGNYARVILMLPEVTLIDLNHLLAGQPLLVTVQVVTIEHSDESDNAGIDGDAPTLQI
jgi:FKBP-type peptidyl-prolyl cis-trans isomerase 2